MPQLHMIRLLLHLMAKPDQSMALEHLVLAKHVVREAHRSLQACLQNFWLPAGLIVGNKVYPPLEREIKELVFEYITVR